jgi:hypothetical protein
MNHIDHIDHNEKDLFLIEIESSDTEENLICNTAISRKEFFCGFSTILALSFVVILLLMKQYIPYF